MKRGWEIMRRSVMALFLRELKTRFGKYQLGYAWALIEPLGTIAVMLAVFTAMGAVGYSGISFPLFLATGVIVNSLFVEISNRSIKAL
jgi:capsular polysaccharide transport system permease protein